MAIISFFVQLFDFDLEVQPILEVLVGKTTEQALGEVAQEEELATLREQQRRFNELRDAELAERQRLAAHDLRLHQEKERRVAEARVAQVAAVEARERAAAAVLVQGYVAELLPSVLAGLRDQGYLMERIERGQYARDSRIVLPKCSYVDFSKYVLLYSIPQKLHSLLTFSIPLVIILCRYRRGIHALACRRGVERNRVYHHESRRHYR